MSSSRSGAKLFVAFAVLGAAFMLARPFRHEDRRRVRQLPEAGEQVVLRETPAPADIEMLRPEAPTAEIQPTLLAPPSESGGGQVTAEGADRLAPPPAMARTYPASVAPVNPANLVSEVPISAGQRSKQRIHRVRDGDTLESLAQRYLGDRARWREIYAANSDQIPRPDLLPLAAQLVIPPRNEQLSGLSDELSNKALTQAPMVPIGSDSGQGEGVGVR